MFRLGLVGAVAFFGLCFFFLFVFEKEDYPVIVDSKIITEKEIADSDPADVLVQSPHSFARPEVTLGLSSSDKADIRDWHKADVLTIDAANSDYASYDESLLSELAQSGDVKAMKLLVTRYLKRSNETSDLEVISELSEKIDALVEKSVIYGDRELFGMMPGKNLLKAKLVSPLSSPAEKRDAAINLLAYGEFMGLRGSLGDKYQEQMTLYSTYSNYGLPQQLSENDKTVIRTQAKSIYDEYEQKRLHLGLGAFDNTIPEGKKKAFELQYQQYLEEMGGNAI